MKKSILLSLLLLTILVVACKKDNFNINADYKEITVVYGLLDQSESRHYIKINKTYLGEGDAFDYAQIPDSSEYAEGEISAKVVELVNGNEIRNFPLNRMTITRDPNSTGDFFNGAQVIYYFDETDLKAGATYRLEVYKGEELDVSAETVLLGETVIEKPAPIQNNLSLKTPVHYPQIPVDFRFQDGVQHYEVYVTLEYAEERTDRVEVDTIKIRKKLFEVPDTEIGNAGGIYSKSGGVSAESILKWIGEEVSVDPQVVKRSVRGLGIEVYGADSDFNTYMKINAPATGINQNRPEFTNIDNGLGLFSSKNYSVKKELFPESGLSDDEFVSGQYTSGRAFCFDIAFLETIYDAGYASTFLDNSCL